MTWMTHGHDLGALDAINNSGLWITWMNLGRELRVVDAMKSLGLWMKWLQAMKLELRMIWKAQGCGLHKWL